MQCNSCGAANPADAGRCQRCQIRFAPPTRHQHSSAAPQLDFVEGGSSSSIPLRPAAHSFEVISNPTANRLNTPTQPDLFSYSPQGKVVHMRAPLAEVESQFKAHHPEEEHRPMQASQSSYAAGTGGAPASAEDPLYARSRSAPRRARTSASQFDLNFGPPAHRPFSNELQPLHGLTAAPLRVRFYSLSIDALVVSVLSIMFAAAVFVAFRASGDRLGIGDLLSMPWYLPAAVPVVLSIAYKALWAVFEQPTIGLQCFGLDVISMDGHRPTIGQRMVRVFAGWLTVGGMVGALWAVVSQERYSMQDMISQTFLTYRPE